MKGKKYKRSQHFVQNVYEKYFGIRKPYQILVDAPFCIETLKIKIAAVEAFTEVFGGAVKLMTTPCIQAELEKHDREHHSGAAFVAKRFEVRRCQHDKGSKTGSECIKDLISTKNPHHYCVAGQDIQLRKDLRKITGVPLVFILRDTVLMEAPTDKTLEFVRKFENKKLKKVDLEVVKKVVDKITQEAPVDLLDSSDATKTAKMTKKKKKTGGLKTKSPNPLSCKKPKKANVQKSAESTINNNGNDGKPSKKPRKRRPKKKKSVELNKN